MQHNTQRYSSAFRHGAEKYSYGTRGRQNAPHITALTFPAGTEHRPDGLGAQVAPRIDGRARLSNSRRERSWQYSLQHTSKGYADRSWVTCGFASTDKQQDIAAPVLLFDNFIIAYFSYHPIDLNGADMAPEEAG